MPRIKSIRWIIIYRTGHLIEYEKIWDILRKAFGQSFNPFSLDIEQEIQLVLQGEVRCVK